MNHPYFCLIHNQKLLVAPTTKSILLTEEDLPKGLNPEIFREAKTPYGQRTTIAYAFLTDEEPLEAFDSLSINDLNKCNPNELRALSALCSAELTREPSDAFFNALADHCFPLMKDAWALPYYASLKETRHRLQAFKDFTPGKFSKLVYSAVGFGLFYGLFVAGRDRGWTFTLAGLFLLWWLFQGQAKRPVSNLTKGLTGIAGLLFVEFSLFSGFPTHFWTTLVLIPLLVIIGIAMHAPDSMVFRLDHVPVGLKRLFVEPFRSFPLLRTLRKHQRQQEPLTVASQKRRDVLLGIGIALPLLAVALTLLASSDAVFASVVRQVLSSLDQLFSSLWIYRLILIFVSALIALAFITASYIPPVEPLQREAKPTWRYIPAMIVLGSINGLYGLYTIIQIAHLYLGLGTLPAGLTYANYARSGFFELVFLAMLNIAMVVLIQSKTDRSTPGQRKAFNTLNTLMCLMTLQFLAASFYKLGLYESAYGYTYLRLWVQAAILGIALCFLWILKWIWSPKASWFHQCLLTFFVLFTLSTLVLNDYTIATLNLRHYESVKANQTDAPIPMDVDYLCGLSIDAAPAIFNLPDTDPAYTRLKKAFYAAHSDEKNSRDPFAMSLLFYIGSHQVRLVP